MNRHSIVAGIRLPALFWLLLSLTVARADAQWTDVTSGALGDSTHTHGLAWADFDGDGDLDLFIANDGVNRLLRNDGGDTLQWSFTDVAGSMGAALDNGERARMGIWGDYDNDGDVDLYLVNEFTANHLFRNDPVNPDDPGDTNRVFVDVTTTVLAGIAQSHAAAWVDYDRDGDLDLFLATGTVNQLLRNVGVDPDTGLPQFVDVTTAVGLTGSADTQAAAWGDYDGDGDQDLYLVNYNTANVLWRNDPADPAQPAGSGRVFVQVGTTSPLADTGPGRGGVWGDYDNDGDLDLYVTEYGAPNLLLRNDGGGVFTDVSAATGLADTGNGRGCAWIDYDNDADLDLFVVNFDDGVVTVGNRLWRNDGPGAGPNDWVFTDVTDTVLAVAGTEGATAAWADYDADGDLDVYLANWDTAHPNRLIRNDNNVGHWLHVELSGRAANRSAMGSRLTLAAGGVLQLREIPGGDGYLSQNTLVAEFGLGAVTQTDSLVVAWPSGNRQVLGALAADQWLTIVEPGPLAPVLDPLPPYSNDGTNLLSWTDMGAGEAVAYEVVATTDAAFDSLWATSGWITGTSYQFTGIPDGLRLYYRVRARDADGFVSPWSVSVTSVQDASPPVSSVTALPDTVVGLPFAVTYTATDLGSGVADVTLYYAHQDTTLFTSYATRTDGQPFLFTLPDGPGVYYFYTVATDSVGQVELPPSGYDAAVTVLPPEWVNVSPADGSGVGNAGNGRGAAWGDFDGDGRHDLFLSNRPVWSTGADATNHLFHNDGPDANDPDGWLFSDVTQAVMQDGGYSQGVAWGDFDGDGDLDIYQANMQVSPNYPAPNRLYRNNGDGTFTDIAPLCGVDDGGSGRSVSWADYDGDGDLDLYLCNDGPNHLWRNDGADPQDPNGWLFTDIAPTNGTGIGDDQYTMGCAWADFDNDGDPDLYLTNYLDGTNRLFRNDGEDPLKAGQWIFTEIAAAAGVADSGSGMGCIWGDYDNDGWLDLYVTNNGPNRLYHHVPGQDLFEDVTAQVGEGAGDGQYGAGCSWVDYDNDGDLDLYVGNHWPDSGPEFAANRLLRNDGEDPLHPGVWRFVDVAPAGGYGIADSASTNSVTWCDFDGDGDLDAYLVSMTGQPNKLLRNDTPATAGNHWLQVDLQAHQANTTAIGARLRVVAGGRSMLREINGGAGFLSQDPMTAAFGLGQAAVVDTLEISWPSGIRQILTGLTVDQRLTLEEPGPDAPTMVPEPLFTAGTTNAVSWSDESASGAVAYQVQLSDSASFVAPFAVSDWVGDTTAVFTDLANGETIWYRVRAIDADSLISSWSLPVFSTQDASLPDSYVEPVTIPYDGMPFDITYVATDSVSGVATVELYYSFGDSVNYTLYGTRTDGSPFRFDIPHGPGLYRFYTIAIDQVGNREAVPDSFDVAVVVNPPLWVDIAPADGSGVGSSGNSRGVAWGDYDSDGRPDLFIVNRPVWSNPADDTNHLLHNDGPALANPDSVAFSDVTPPVMQDDAYSNGVAWGDFDGDGDLDLYQANMFVNPNFPSPNHLYRNDGDGVFTDIAPQCGVDDGGSGRTVAWVDFDRDGDLDLYLCNNGPNHLWRNDGPDTTGTTAWLFTDVAADTLTIGDSQYTMGCAWGDYDNDGDPDVYLANYLNGTNRLLRNDGPDPQDPDGWLWTDVAPQLGLDDSESSVGCAWGDFDDDGWLDLYVTNRGPNRLFHNVTGLAKRGTTAAAAKDGDLGLPEDVRVPVDPSSIAFVDIAPLYDNGLDDGLYGAGLGWADIDNDGDLDLYVGNHWLNDSGDIAPNLLLRNDGPDPDNATGWLFTNIAPPTGENIGDDASTNGVAWADVDGDGDVDLYMASMSGVRNKLFRNDLADSMGNHWLQLDLRSLTANTTSIGARARVVAGGRVMNRYVEGCTGFLSQGSQTLQFGLGDAVLVDTLEVFWPTGEHQMLLAVPADQRLLVQQVVTGVDDGHAPALPRTVRVHQNYPNPFNPSTTIRFELPREQQVRLIVYAVDGSRVAVLVDGVLDAGVHSVVWDGRTSAGGSAASGVYLYRLETPTGSQTKRMLMIK